ncbi:glucosamine 6-phosphate N-acetyltransferase-like isoform X1 [Corticium candelabrum]|uniref:glucosamine 6-phosphate N-acetyltransferase-like isoform X1 n=1 Tax=Corticium candelabrum TaxID=121492 RepID=UPI002E2533BC|nr:glucosamine 6-phosphate N-acetyltransferase-like isoform X1 [Corticium candelabrum]
MSGKNDKFLFDSSLLYNLDFSQCVCAFNPAVTPERPGDGLVMRPLQIHDYDKGYLDLLSQLTVVGEITRSRFQDQFGAMKKAANHFVVVIEDVTVGKIISSATLLIEHKFIHRASQRGRVEDVVVHEGHRGKQLAKLMLESLRLLSIELGCYKLTLECDEKMRPFYEKFGFKLGSTLFLQLRFFE